MLCILGYTLEFSRFYIPINSIKNEKKNIGKVHQIKVFTIEINDNMTKSNFRYNCCCCLLVLFLFSYFIVVSDIASRACCLHTQLNWLVISFSKYIFCVFTLYILVHICVCFTNVYSFCFSTETTKQFFHFCFILKIEQQDIFRENN